MNIRITGVTEAEVERVTALLDVHGFEYDADYTTLYGAAWAIVGLEFTNPAAAQVAVTAYADAAETDAVADAWAARVDAADSDFGGV
jgi:hypothetical protein